jgi:NADH-quinone oxidoreductase subunit M
VLTATYLLAVVRRVFMGPAATDGESPVTELTAVETATWTPLVLLTVATGVWPALLLGVTNPAVRVLMKGV